MIGNLICYYMLHQFIIAVVNVVLTSYTTHCFLFAHGAIILHLKCTLHI